MEMVEKETADVVRLLEKKRIMNSSCAQKKKVITGVRGQNGKVVGDHRGATVTQITTGYNQGLKTSKLLGTLTSSLHATLQNYLLHEEDKIHKLELLLYFVVVNSQEACNQLTPTAPSPLAVAFRQ